MNKNVLSLFCLLLFSMSIQAQKKVIDSLKIELQNHTTRDTVRVNLLNTLAYTYRSYDISIAEEKSIEANNLAKELDYEKGLARSILIFSKIHVSKSEYPEALEDALKSLELYKKEENYKHKDIIAVYNTLGMISSYQNDPNKSLDYFNKALDVAKEGGNRRDQADMLNNIGITYYSKGDLDEAVTFYKKSIAIYEQLGLNKRTESAINNIAVIFTIQGRYTEALEYYNEILVSFREDNKKDDIAMTTQNMGILYSKLGQHEKAYSYFDQSLQLFKELEEKEGIAKALINIGDVFTASKEYPKALDYFTEGLIIAKEIDAKETLATCNNNIGKVHLLLQQPKLALKNFESSLDLGLSLGDKRNIGYSNINLAEAYFMLKEYPKALQHAIEGKQIVDKLEMLAEQKEVNNTLSKIYEVRGEFKKALSSHRQFKILNDSLFNKENIENMTQLEYEYKYKQQLDSASIRELKLTKTVKDTSQDLKKSQRNYLLSIIGFLLVSILLGGIIFYLKFRNIKSEAQNIVIEQKLLRSQMTPHFIFNSLSILQGMILNKEEKKAVSYLSKFSKLLRIILENSRDKTVALSQELAAIENYLALQNLENEAYNYTVSVDETIDISLFEVPPMLIQPFVENAIEHAFINQQENRKISIHLKYIDKNLICTIADNGVGIGTQIDNKQSDKKSLSTTITSERLQILSKDFKMKGSVTIEDRQKYNEQGTMVTLLIPYKMNPAI